MRSFNATTMPDRDWWTVLWPDPEEVLGKLGAPTGRNAIDLCCGDGYFTTPLARISAPGTVYALEMDPDVLQLAREYLEAGEICNCVFIQDDAMNVARRVPEQVDFVLFANTFHGVPDQTGLASEIREVLVREGRLAVVNWYPALREQTPVLGEPRGPAAELRMSPEQTKKVVSPAGFNLERILKLSPYHYGACFERRG